jgi:hypothetical protein
MPGFFDKDSYKGYLGGWGRGVIVGRGRLGSTIQFLQRGPLDRPQFRTKRSVEIIRLLMKVIVTLAWLKCESLR